MSGMKINKLLSPKEQCIVKKCIQHLRWKHSTGKSLFYGNNVMDSSKGSLDSQSCSGFSLANNNREAVSTTDIYTRCDRNEHSTNVNPMKELPSTRHGNTTTASMSGAQGQTISRSSSRKTSLFSSTKSTNLTLGCLYHTSHHTHNNVAVAPSAQQTSNEGCPAGFHHLYHNHQHTHSHSMDVDLNIDAKNSETLLTEKDVTRRMPVSACPFSAGLSSSSSDSKEEAQSQPASTFANARPMSEIPGPQPLPYIGTMYKYIPPFGDFSDKDCIKRDTKKLQKYGEIVREEIFPGTTLLHLFHPDDMETVYRHNGKFPGRGLVNALAKYRKDKGLPLDMINAQGQEWRRMRTPAQKHLYNPKAVAAYVSVQDPICDDLVQVIREKRDCGGSIHDTSKELNKWALECIGTLMYDTRMGVMQAELPRNSFADEIFRNLMVAFDAIYNCIFFWPLHKSGKTKMWKEFTRTMDYIRETSKNLTGQCVEKHRAGEQGLVDESLNLPLSIISDDTISDLEALDVQTSLLMGGIDTTSYSTLFALYHLAVNPDKQATLYEELTRLNPTKKPSTPEMLSEAKYLKAVLKENFRMNPVFPFVARLLTDDIVIRGYRIPAGTRVLNHHGVASRRTEFVEQPEVFYPERWMRDQNNGGINHKFACMPFGFGPRMCIGRRYAEQELLLVLSKLVQNFKIEYDGPPLKFHSKLLYCPSQKMSFRFVDRK